MSSEFLDQPTPAPPDVEGPVPQGSYDPASLASEVRRLGSDARRFLTSGQMPPHADDLAERIERLEADLEEAPNPPVLGWLRQLRDEVGQSRFAVVMAD